MSQELSQTEIHRLLGNKRSQVDHIKKSINAIDYKLRRVDNPESATIHNNLERRSELSAQLKELETDLTELEAAFDEKAWHSELWKAQTQRQFNPNGMRRGG